MGLSLLKTFDCGCILGMWKIQEEVDNLYSAIQPYLNLIEVDIINGIKSIQRKKEWICTRLLVKEILGTYHEIFHDIYGKPFLNSNYKISISHSCHLVAVMLTEKPIVGMDVQVMSDKIAKIALKFLNPEELENIDVDRKIEHLYANWCAKETLLKIYGKRYIDFKKNIKILPFNFKDEGQFRGKIEVESINREYLLNYFTLDDDTNPAHQYMVVWYCE